MITLLEMIKILINNKEFDNIIPSNDYIVTHKDMIFEYNNMEWKIVLTTLNFNNTIGIKIYDKYYLRLRNNIVHINKIEIPIDDILGDEISATLTYPILRDKLILQGINQ